MSLVNETTGHNPNHHVKYKHHRTNWENYSACSRGPVDRNFVYDDGSARRLRQLRMRDPRTVQLPAVRWWSGQVYLYLPPYD